MEMTDTNDFDQGWRLHQAGDLRGAEEAYRRALRRNPEHGRTWFALAQLCERDKRPAEAIACFRRGLEITPREAEGWYALGNVCLAERQFADAEAAYRKCVAIRPDHARGHGNLGFTLNELNRPKDAQAAYEKSLKLCPDLAEVHHNLGNLLREDDRLADAIVRYDRALQIRPDYGKAWINRGIALMAQGRLDEAIADLERGVGLRPDLPDSHTSLGAALSVVQRFDEALAAYERALTLNGEHAEAGWNQSLIHLLRGDYERGFAAYEWRWKCKRTKRVPNFSEPRWDGTPLKGRTILLYGEQGLGDTLQFIRYAPMVKALGGRVIVNCQNALIRLLTRTPGIDGLVGWGATPPKFDTWIPLLSLPGIFGTRVDSIPTPIPYVFPDPKLVAHWRRQLVPLRGVKVGIAWQGSPRHAWDRHRSVALKLFESLARIEGIHLVSLQKHRGSEQIDAAGKSFPVLSFGPLLDEASGPFMDTAAIIANLDLVITVDSAMAHLAGALGTPAWVALANTPDWRWGLDRAGSVWYPTHRLFRQPKFGDWLSVFVEMAAALKTHVANRTPPCSPLIEVSAGELIDKITILRIKSRRMTDAGQLRNVQAELATLEAARRDQVGASAALDSLEAELTAVNEKLWDIEDAIRGREAEADFGPRFIDLARSIYRNNLQRAQIKRKINVILGSRLVEEKFFGTPSGSSV